MKLTLTTDALYYTILYDSSSNKECRLASTKGKVSTQPGWIMVAVWAVAVTVITIH